ncbi:hypothetical protein TeGR_g9743, partial [Tetraparma gracilis]
SKTGRLEHTYVEFHLLLSIMSLGEVKIETISEEMLSGGSLPPSHVEEVLRIRSHLDKNTKRAPPIEGSFELEQLRFKCTSLKMKLSTAPVPLKTASSSTRSSASGSRRSPGGGSTRRASAALRRALTQEVEDAHPPADPVALACLEHLLSVVPNLRARLFRAAEVDEEELVSFMRRDIPAAPPASDAEKKMLRKMDSIDKLGFFKKLEHQLPARELGVAADDDGAGLGKAFAW